MYLAAVCFRNWRVYFVVVMDNSIALSAGYCSFVGWWCYTRYFCSCCYSPDYCIPHDYCIPPDYCIPYCYFDQNLSHFPAANYFGSDLTVTNFDFVHKGVGLDSEVVVAVVVVVVVGSRNLSICNQPAHN